MVQSIVCRYHGWRFDSEGKCNRIPAHPQHKISDSFHLRTYASIEKYGLIWCSLTAAQDAEPTIPIMLFWEDVKYQQLIYPKIDIQRFAGRQIEGFMI